MSRLSGSVRHHALQQPHRRDAVDERVVDLRVDRDPAVAQALDQVRLPQRPLAGQPGAVQPRAELEQLADPARLGQRAVPHVVLDVELRRPRPRPTGRRCLSERCRALEEQRRDLVHVEHLLVEVPGVVASRALRLLEQLPDRRRAWASCGSPPSGSRRTWDRSEPAQEACLSWCPAILARFQRLTKGRVRRRVGSGRDPRRQPHPGHLFQPSRRRSTRSTPRTGDVASTHPVHTEDDVRGRRRPRARGRRLVVGPVVRRARRAARRVEGA